jgi:pimeloyl-ACP methyl ester carboxylesterase
MPCRVPLAPERRSYMTHDEMHKSRQVFILRHFCYAFMAACFLALVAAPAGAASEKQVWQVSKRERCFLPGLEDAADCLTLTVPLDWSAPLGRKINIFTAVLPALSRNRATDAVMLVPGGPGQSGDGLISLATGTFRDMRQTRDIMMLYPRGTKRSAPLDCPLLGTDTALSAADTLARVTTCRTGQKNDPAYFTSADIVQDMDAVRAALGYPQLSLWGGSFGSRLVQHYAREYPARTRLVILDAVAPVGRSIFETAPAAAQRALRSVDVACAADTACRRTSPRLADDVATVLSTFAKGPRALGLVDPVTGRSQTLRVDYQMIAGTIHLALYNPSVRALLPQLIAAARQNNFAPLLALGASSAASLEEQISIGANFSALCAEDMQFTDPARLAAAANSSFLGTTQSTLMQQICTSWPKRKLPAAYARGFSSTVPALLLSGALDPVTAPEGGTIAAGYFKNATHVIVPASGHISSTFGCAPRQITAFVTTGKTSAKDFACVQKARPPQPLGTPNG